MARDWIRRLLTEPVSLTQLDDEFFLPDLCQAQPLLFLVLIAELLVFVLVLSATGLEEFSWLQLGLTSLFVQWVVLCSAGLLCNLRPMLAKRSISQATSIGYVLVVLVTVVLSVLAELVMKQTLNVGEIDWLRVFRNLLICVIITGIVFRYFYLQDQLRRIEKAELYAHIQALQSRIRPHFLFNSMNIIASLIPVNPEVAEEVVEDLAVLFRASLNASSDEPVPLAQEIDLCNKYSHIESLRLGDRLKVEWDVDADIEHIKIPMLTLQPLLENAIYHGIQPLAEGGVVSIVVRQADTQLVIDMSNPIGEEDHAHDEGNRMALENIRNRLAVIYGARASMTTDRTTDTYRVRISYPLDDLNAEPTS